MNEYINYGLKTSCLPGRRRKEWLRRERWSADLPIIDSIRPFTWRKYDRHFALWCNTVVLVEELLGDTEGAFFLWERMVLKALTRKSVTISVILFGGVFGGALGLYIRDNWDIEARVSLRWILLIWCRVRYMFNLGL